MRRRLEIGQDVDEEAIRVGVACVGLLWRVILCIMFFLTPATMVVVPLRPALAVVEDDDFVDAEDGEGSGDLPGEGRFQVVRLRAGV